MTFFNENTWRWEQQLLGILGAERVKLAPIINRVNLGPVMVYACMCHVIKFVPDISSLLFTKETSRS